MKRQTRILSCAFVLSLAMQIHAQTMPLYLNINSHNEMDDPNDYAQSAVYSQVKAEVIRIADTIIVNGGRWNMQVESNFILGCLSNDNASTNPDDLLDSLDNLPQIEIDPHNHFDNNVTSPTYNPYNYADLACLLDSCGLAAPRKNMGGFLWQTASDWMPYQTGDTGNTFPDYIWQPNVIWGGGSPGHVNDYNAYGIWKPSGAGTFQFPSHNPARHLTCIGNGCRNVLSDSTPVSDNINAVINVLNYISQQPYDPNAYWTASIQFNFRDINMPGLADSIGVIIRALQSYVNSGQIVWMTLTEKYDNWYTLHTNPADYFLETCDSLALSVEDPVSQNVFGLYPDPAQAVLHLQNSSSTINAIEVYDLSSRLIYRREEVLGQTAEIPLEGFTPGTYLLIVANTDGTYIVQRFVKE